MNEDKVFRGGIQKGTVATDEHARKLDKQCKVIKESVFEDLSSKYPGLTMQRKLTKDQIPGGVGACEPDGGAWFYNDKLIAVFEGKKQQDAGNAIERWYKNNAICRGINADASYITFATGEGAVENGVISKTLNFAHLDGFDTYIPGGNSCFRNPDGFTESEMYDIMHTAIFERIHNTDYSKSVIRINGKTYVEV